MTVKNIYIYTYIFLGWDSEAGFALEEPRCSMNSFSKVTNNYNTVVPDITHQQYWLQSFCPFLPQKRYQA